jgi:hypothetical protein
VNLEDMIIAAHSESSKSYAEWYWSNTPLLAPKRRRVHEKRFDVVFLYPPLKVVSPAVTIPKTPHSPLSVPDDFPPLPGLSHKKPFEISI